jgi:hypothetical protein
MANNADNHEQCLVSRKVYKESMYPIRRFRVIYQARYGEKLDGLLLINEGEQFLALYDDRNKVLVTAGTSFG